MARLITVLFFAVCVIAAGVFSIPLNRGNINVVSPAADSSFKLGSSQLVAWQEKNPNFPAAQPGDTVSLQVWQFGFGQDDKKIQDVASGIPFTDGKAQYTVPSEPEFSNLGFKLDSVNYYMNVVGDKQHADGTSISGISSSFKFTA